MSKFQPKMLNQFFMSIGQTQPGTWMVWYENDPILTFPEVLNEILAKMGGFETQALCSFICAAMNNAHVSGYEHGKEHKQHEIQKALGLAPEED